MLSAVKFIFFFVFLAVNSSVRAKDVFILVVGQSISANCNQHLFKPVPGVYQITKDGNKIIAEDPFEWGDCSQGSMWIPLGQKIIQNGLSDNVIFMPIGVGGTSVSDWEQGGRAFEMLSNAISIVKEKSISVDYLFWHQGSTDINMSSIIYGRKLNSVLRNLKFSFQPKKIIISQHSRCGYAFDKKISRVQKIISNRHGYHFFAGPDTNALGNEYRFDGCHLNKIGQEKMAELWLASMIEADKIQPKYDREILINYFR